MVGVPCLDLFGQCDIERRQAKAEGQGGKEHMNQHRLLGAVVLIFLFGDVSTSAANCKKGIPCGNSCISASKTCHISPAYHSPTPRRSKHVVAPKQYCNSCERANHGRIKRSAAARDDFERSHPCPSTKRRSGPCPGYVIDHIQALKHGGSDTPSNMQWQTIEAAKAKDRIE
jgi:hypothetical protein